MYEGRKGGGGEALERKRAELEEEKKTWETENNTSLAGILLAGKTRHIFIMQTKRLQSDCAKISFSFFFCRLN